MSFEIILTDSFERRVKPLLKRYASIKQDLALLRTELQNNPQAGEALGRDCYKVRLRIRSKNTGKSGGARVITCVKIVNEQVFLLAIYDKSEQDSISDKERDDLLKENDLL
ncbi:type II toxin-antitoxin system RelE/ParE family toxin [uncultured Hymenobacter sp.]|uniref:type II toxin-antitoxin system RelE/ParE family toxin n=1 Tax=uncultured Hymenobacter sp. TaxID=170016 RepID=UPI0035C98A1B